jgi:hypothetical protein
MSSCAASCCICFPKVSYASETSASWPIADVPPLCHFAFNCSVQHHKPSKTSPPPVPAIFGLAPSAVGRCWSSKDLRLLRFSCVLHRPGMPLPHEKTVDITKSLACLSSLPLFSSNQSLLPFSQDTLRRHICLFSHSPSISIGFPTPLPTPGASPNSLFPQLNLHKPAPAATPSGFLQGRAFLAWRHADSRRKQSGNVTEAGR